MSISAFRDEMLRRFEVAYPEVSFQPAEDAIIRYESDDTYGKGQVFVDNSYQLYSNDPGDIDHIINRIVQSLGPVEAENTDISDEEFLSALVLVIRPAGYGSDVPNTPIRVVERPFVADLAEVVAFDSPEALRFVTQEELEERSLSPEEIFPIAAGNIAAHLGEIYEEPYETMTFLSTSNGLGTSYPLLPGSCAPDSKDHAFWIVDRETILRTELDRGEPGQALFELAYVVAGAMENGYGMSEAVITCIAGEWGYAVPNFAEE